MKYFDDTTAAAKIDLKNDLVPDSRQRERPLNWNEKSQLVLKSENNLLQQDLVEFENFTRNNLMKINPKKSNILLFNMPLIWKEKRTYYRKRKY